MGGTVYSWEFAVSQGSLQCRGDTYEAMMIEDLNTLSYNPVVGGREFRVRTQILPTPPTLCRYDISRNAKTFIGYRYSFSNPRLLYLTHIRPLSPLCKIVRLIGLGLNCHSTLYRNPKSYMLVALMTSSTQIIRYRVRSQCFIRFNGVSDCENAQKMNGFMGI